MSAAGGAALAVAAVALALGVAVLRRAKFYRRMFSEAHFRELHARFAAAVQSVTDVQRAPANRVDMEAAGDAFVTSAQLAIAVTASRSNGHHALHVSLSQASGYTTSSVANRFGFFLISMLNQNKMELDLFFTPSRVHHLVFTTDAESLRIRDFAPVEAEYRSAYHPLPYAERQVTPPNN